jgi:hypothetical protein
MANRKKKSPKVVGLEKVLEKLPEEERASARETVLEAFKNFDPSKSKPVRPLPDGTKDCPDCGRKLHVKKGATEIPSVGQRAARLVHFAECHPCREFFMLEAKS